MPSWSRVSHLSHESRSPEYSFSWNIILQVHLILSYDYPREEPSSTFTQVVGLCFNDRLTTDEDVPVGIRRGGNWKASIFICYSI